MNKIIDGQKYRVALLLVFAVVLASLTVTDVRSTSQNDIDNAVRKALAYIASNQDESGYFKEPTYDQIIASTALAVLAFENSGHFATNDPSVDPYASAVSKGLDYLVLKTHEMQIGQKNLGNPDTNGNGYGAYWDSGSQRYVAYETPMVIMALVGSNTPQKRITLGSYFNSTYEQLVTDAVDWLSWAQVSETSGYRGGWRYGIGSTDADNSVSQWPAIGLRSAEYWGIFAPEFVKSELVHWVDSSQNLDHSSPQFGGFWYTLPNQFENDGIPATGAGICELDYAGAKTTDDHIQYAMLYLNKFWESQYNIGFPYAMYAVMKACRDATPPVSAIGGHDWYNEYAQWLVQNQRDGTWPTTGQGGEMLNAEFGVLVLSKTLIFGHYSVTLFVTDETGNALENATLTIDSPDNHTLSDSDGIAVFKNIAGGNHTFTATIAGYDSIFVASIISQDTIISLTLTSPEPYLVTIEVSDQTRTLLNDVTISFDGRTTQTDTYGKAFFTNVSKSDYSINATKTGFEPTSVFQHVYKNMTLGMTLHSKQSESNADLFIQALEFGVLTALIIANCAIGSLYIKNRRKLVALKKI